MCKIGYDKGSRKGWFKKGHKTNIGKVCSKKTRLLISQSHLGEKHWQWKGGRAKCGKYIRIQVGHNHPYAFENGYILEHRYIMEQYIGRYLKPSERVHHINEITTDNRIENLMLFKSILEHKKFHPNKVQHLSEEHKRNISIGMKRFKSHKF